MNRLSEKTAVTVPASREVVNDLVCALGKVIVGQRHLVERMLVAILSDGHILIEGVPGLAKTTAVKTLAALIDASFNRIQFTPDLLPADLIGTLIYHPSSADFLPKKGPLFANIVLADEVNRAPAKIHSALLEAMEERQVTIGEQSHLLEPLFMVLATQNPIEQEGTYPLPEAQMDRFMMKIVVEYPSREEEREILRRSSFASAPPAVKPVASPGEILALREEVKSVYLDEKIEQYILDIVFATRNLSRRAVEKWQRYLEFGASPRASIHLATASRALSLLRGRGYVVPHDVKELAPDVLRHRLITSYEADVDGVTVESVIADILASVPVP